MKSAMSRSAFGRRVIPGTVLALAAATLSLAGPASAANDIELQGHVSGAGGVALVGVYVEVDDTAGNYIADTNTDASGNYSFNALSAGNVKVYFQPDNAASDPITMTTPLPYQDRWSGGSRYQKGATVTAITVDPATPASVNITLPQYASISGNIRVGANAALPPSGAFGANALDTDQQYAGGTGFTDDATGDYRMYVDPSTPLRVFAGADGYISQYWTDADTPSTATPIAISPGQNVTGINFRLTNVLRVRQAPSIAGYPTVGLPLTVSPGTWTKNAMTEFSYAWLRNGVQVGTGATYTPTVADFGQKLVVVVTALNGDFTGQSSTITSDAVRYASTVKGAAKSLAGLKVRFSIKMVSAHQKPVKGKVVVLRGTKVVHKAVKLVKGKAVILVKHQPKGKQVFTVHYLGNKKLSKVDKTFTVRVHK